MRKNILVVSLFLFLTACTIPILDEPKVGMEFSSGLWADKREDGSNTRDPNNSYFYVGKVSDGILFRKNPRDRSPFQGGIVVSNGRIVRVLSQSELTQFMDNIKKTAADAQRANKQKEEQNRKNAIAQFQSFRELARNDVVAQVLNYSVGAPENASGSAFFYPVNNQNGACIYRLATDKSDVTNMGVGMANEMQGFMNGIGMGSIVNPSQQANWYSGEFDLNKFDLKKVKFYQVQSTQRNRYSGPTANLSYKTQVEGLTEFECNSTVCNIDRLRNGWRVLATKCKGTAKAF